MDIQEGIRKILTTMDSAGWSQMSREELVAFAVRNDIRAKNLFADSCLSIGIGSCEKQSKPSVKFFFRRMLQPGE